MRLLTGPAEDVDSKDLRMKGLFISREEALILKAERKMEYVV